MNKSTASQAAPAPVPAEASEAAAARDTAGAGEPAVGGGPGEARETVEAQASAHAREPGEGETTALTPPPLRLRAFLPYRLSALSNLVSGLIADDYSARFDLSIPQWRVMAVLAEHDELIARDIEPIVRMDKVAISRAVRSLTERGLVHRRASQRDGRLAYLSLTAAGRGIYRQVRPIALRHEEELLAALSPGEAAQLSELLTKLDERALALQARAGDGEQAP